MQRHIISSLLFTTTLATYTAENPTQKKDTQVVHHIISRGYPQKNYAQKSPAELLQNVILNDKKESHIQDNSLNNLKKSNLFIIDTQSKL